MIFSTLLGKLLEYFVRFTTWGSCYFSWDNMRWDEFLSSRYGWVVTNQNTDITLVHSWLIEVWQFANYILAEYDYTPLGTSISPKRCTFESMICLFPRWDIWVPWRVLSKPIHLGYQSTGSWLLLCLHNSTGCSWTTPSFSCFWLVSYIYVLEHLLPQRD